MTFKYVFKDVCNAFIILHNYLYKIVQHITIG